MFFDDEKDIEKLARSTGFSIFVLPNNTKPLLNGSDKNHLVIFPEDNNQIGIEKIREIIDRCRTKQTKPFFIYVFNAETMNEKAENAFLKQLEEPPENYHFALFTNSPSSLLPTILSRGDLYIKRIEKPLEQPIIADEKIKKYSRCIISAKNTDLVSIVNDLLNDKDCKKNTRDYALKVLETAIEMLYKSYFVNSNQLFLKKLEKLLLAYDNLKQNGHIKLHLIADLC